MARIKEAKSLVAVLQHPLRTTILDILNERSMSPSAFVDAKYIPPAMYSTRQQALSMASYHFRELEEAGLIECIESIPRRGAVEHVYEGKVRVYFSDKDFEKMSFEERQGLSQVSFAGVTARTERAIRLGTFDARTDRHLSWRAMKLDGAGWKEMVELLSKTHAAAEQIREGAESRLWEQAEIEEKDHELIGIPATVALFGYESPPMEPYKTPRP